MESAGLKDQSMEERANTATLASDLRLAAAVRECERTIEEAHRLEMEDRKAQAAAEAAHSAVRRAERAATDARLHLQEILKERVRDRTGLTV